MRLKIRKTSSGTYYIPSLSIKQLRDIVNQTKKKMDPQQRPAEPLSRSRVKPPCFTPAPRPQERGTEGAAEPVLLQSSKHYFLEREEAPPHPRSRAEWVAPMSVENNGACLMTCLCLSASSLLLLLSVRR